MTVYDLNRISPPKAPPGFRDDTGDAHFVPAPCQVACPVGTDAPSYIAQIWEGRYAEAFEAITATNPFSSICGRVCDAPCEPACRRTASDGPLQIRNLKRFVMDQVGHRYDPPPVPVTKTETVGIIGAGPAGLVAAHDLCVAGYEVHVYEMTDRLGGMMVWGIPAFRLPPGIIDEDIDRLRTKCAGLNIHLNTALGSDISLQALKQKHDAVLLTIGSWWGKPMGVSGEDHPNVVDGVSFLRRVNAGERPRLPSTVVIVGGGDVAMDACRVARRLPGCEHVKVVYRRGPKEIPARAIELEGAVKEGIEFTYHTQPLTVTTQGDRLLLRAIKTTLGDPEDDGRRRPVPIADSEHDIECGMVIAAVGQKGACEELDQLGMMETDRVRAEFDGMRTADPKVFAAGDGAFGGSTIVMAMSHGQRAAYYINAFLQGVDTPMPYRTPYRTRRVPVAQDLSWEQLPLHHPEFLGLGKDPIKFPEIETTYDPETARKEAARCYRCDAETGSADYSVQHREDLFSMARINLADTTKQKAMLQRRLMPRENPFPQTRPPQFDDLVFLPANLSRLVIDPYREACRVDFRIGSKMLLGHPFLVSGFGDAPVEVRDAVARGLVETNTPYLGTTPLAELTDVGWFQLLRPGDASANPEALALVQTPATGAMLKPMARMSQDQLLGLVMSAVDDLEQTLRFALDNRYDFLLLNGTGAELDGWPELGHNPDLGLLRDTVASLRRMGCEEAIDLIYYGGVRSGSDAAKLVGLGAVAMVMSVAAGLAAGGHIEAETVRFDSDLNADERAQAVANVIRASIGEASMMARCTGKTDLHNIEPEDLRAITLATAQATGIPLAGTRA